MPLPKGCKKGVQGQIIRQLMHEGYPQAQSVAISYSEMWRRKCKGAKKPLKRKKNPDTSFDLMIYDIAEKTLFKIATDIVEYNIEYSFDNIVNIIQAEVAEQLVIDCNRINKEYIKELVDKILSIGG